MWWRKAGLTCGGPWQQERRQNGWALWVNSVQSDQQERLFHYSRISSCFFFRILSKSLQFSSRAFQHTTPKKKMKIQKKTDKVFITCDLVNKCGHLICENLFAVFLNIHILSGWQLQTFHTFPSVSYKDNVRRGRQSPLWCSGNRWRAMRPIFGFGSVDQSLSVYDAMKRTLQPDGSCSQGQYSSV